MNRPTITAAVITLNEERNLPGWLKSLAWADELLIVDGSSEDRTAEISRGSHARFFSRTFDNFAAQRNFALAQATSDWVFFVDADERPTDALVREVHGRLVDCRQAGFRVPIRSEIFGRPFRFSGTQDDCPVRLVRRGAGEFAGAVHEVLRVRGPLGRLNAHLRHTTIADLRSFLAKMHRYTDLEAMARWRAGRRPLWRDRWIAPPREIFRRLVWKHGWLDGPRGWAFCVLSGLSEWVLAGKHQRLVATAHWHVELERLRDLSPDDLPAGGKMPPMTSASERLSLSAAPSEPFATIAPEAPPAYRPRLVALKSGGAP